MIRRDVALGNGAAGWMLISQVEHARLSGELASHCTAPMPGRTASTSAVHNEFLDAIAHHDDGWIAWEASPQLDASTGRPLAFNELPTSAALSIWSASIEQSAARSPLAGWMVASHFKRLLELSDSMEEASDAPSWRAHYEEQRFAWMEQWRVVDPANRTRRLADALVEWLWVFDAASLWLCLHCPLPGTSTELEVERWRLDEGGTLDMTWSASTGTGEGLASARSADALAAPWLFDAPFLELRCAAQVVVQQRYCDAQELLSAARPYAFAVSVRPR